MWNRAELKRRARNAFHANYWKCVFIALILTLLIDNEEYTGAVTAGGNNIVVPSYGVSGGYFTALSATFMTVALIIGLILVVLRIFVFNLLEIGGCRFFCENTYSRAPFRSLLWGFDSGNWFNIVKIIFLRDIKLVLWSLLFVIPGIIKSYEYRMVPYILSENPSMDSAEVFRRSREMMDGNKMDAFVLDLSFIGWKFLGAITFGLVDLFWTNPYQYAANAELYMALRSTESRPQW